LRRQPKVALAVASVAFVATGPVARAASLDPTPDPLARNGHLLLIGALGGAILACGGPGLSPVGVSPPRAPERTAIPGAGASEPPPVPADFRSRMARASERFLSRGHGEKFDGIIWANEIARAAADPQSVLADGSIFVEEAIAGDTRGERSAGLLVMTKRGEAFRFDAVEPDGGVASRERVDACVACHRETTGFVFPWPRQVAPGPGEPGPAAKEEGPTPSQR
jgi:hypothetical protein